MGKSIIEIVGEIIAGQSSQRTLSGEDIANLIKITYQSLKEIETLESSGTSLEEIDAKTQPGAPETEAPGKYVIAFEPQIEPQKSIQHDKIVCIECGSEFKVLTHTHLKMHNLLPEEYKIKWGIPPKTVLAARSVSDRRKAAAREKNIGEFLKQKRADARGGELRSGELFQPVKAAPEKEEG